eukprot:scaffold5766_cov350-Prasinococcus_capsulatus_cf.AAC.1
MYLSSNGDLAAAAGALRWVLSLAWVVPGFDLLGEGGALVLGRLCFALGTFEECAAPSPAATSLAPLLLEVRACAPPTRRPSPLRSLTNRAPPLADGGAARGAAAPRGVRAAGRALRVPARAGGAAPGHRPRGDRRSRGEHTGYAVPAWSRPHAIAAAA